MALSSGREALKTQLMVIANNTDDQKTKEQAIDDFLDALIPFLQTGTITFPPGTPIATSAGAGTITGPMTTNLQ